jgi:hypothetical protein
VLLPLPAEPPISSNRRVIGLYGTGDTTAPVKLFVSTGGRTHQQTLRNSTGVSRRGTHR